jgi:hypothetical protein
MPIYNVLPHVPNIAPQQILQQAGLLLIVEIQVPQSLAALLGQNNIQLPQPVVGNALVDTGASMCCVEEVALQQLGLQPISESNVATPAGVQVQNVYLPRLTFPGTPLPPLEIPVLGSHLAQGNMISLIGRDILAHCVLVYNGPMGSYTLAF